MLYLSHILDAIREIEGFIEGKSGEEVFNDHTVYYGMLYMLAVIGEASGNLSVSCKERYSEIAWQDVKDMRNILIHEYFDVSFDIVWKTVKERLPELKQVVEKAIAEGSV